MRRMPAQVWVSLFPPALHDMRSGPSLDSRRNAAIVPRPAPR